MGAPLAVPLLIVGAVVTIHLLPRRGLPAEIPFGKPGAAVRRQAAMKSADDIELAKKGPAKPAPQASEA